MEIDAFLESVITTESGFFNLALRENGTEWTQVWFEWPAQQASIAEYALNHAPSHDVYFSAHLFASKTATKQNVLPSRTIQADLDNAEVPATNGPNLLVETSPNRHQGFWLLRDIQSPEDLESLSRQVTYSIPDADRSGWSLGHKMRLPGTYNHKYPSGPKLVKIINSNLTSYSTMRLTATQRRIVNDIPNTDEWQPAKPTEPPRQLWMKVKSKLPRRVQASYDVRQQDRSTALWSLMLSLFRAGLSRDQVFWIAHGSENNKFKDNKFHADLDLAKDVLRAELALKRGTDSPEDIKSRIMEARRLPGLVTEKRAYIADLVYRDLKNQGSFINTPDGFEWYVREDTGRPVILSRYSEHLNSLLETRYGLNSSEQEQKYVVAYLASQTKERGQSGSMAMLSHFDKSHNLIYVHTGRREVLRIAPDDITAVPNGTDGIVFPWRSNEEPFDPDFTKPLNLDSIFNGCFDNLNEMPPNEAAALIKTWLYFLFFRNDAISRPLLALFGQPGSGKSTLFRRIYTVIYGRNKAVNTVTKAEDYDFAVSNDPLVVFDNVDTWSPWLPDKLALSASPSDLIKRKLYTDLDSITLRRQALVGLTAHNPKFRREDIVDRLIILSLHRLAAFDPESDIIQKIYDNRDSIWGGIILDLQMILRYNQPSIAEIPKFRISDYARIGLWIAKALGFEQDFRSALESNIREQTSYNLEEEDILVETIKIWLTQSRSTDKWFTPGELWTQWQSYSRDQVNFMRQYRNAVVLGKKLWSLQETLSAVFKVEYQFNVSGRLWRFSLK